MKNFLADRLPIKKLRESTFVRDAFALSLGTGFAQAVLLGAMPVLSRLYSPEDFGVFALYMAIATTLSFFSTAGLEHAVILPRETRDALGLILMIFILGLAAAMVLFAAAYFFNDEITTLIGAPELGPWLYFIPLSVLFTAMYRGLRFWMMRRRRFAAAAVGVASQSGVFGLVSMVTGALRPANATLPEAGLIGGQILGDAAYVAVGLRHLRRRDWIILSVARYSTLKSLMIKYRNLAITLTASQTISMIYSRLPVFVIASAFGTAQVGLYAFAQRIMTAPALLIAGAIGDVFRQRATVQWQEHGRFDQLVIKTLMATAAIAVVPYAVGIIILPDLFAFIFGEKWRIAGEYGAILMIGGFFQFVITPIDYGSIVVGAYRYIFFWTLLRLILKAIAGAAAILGYIDIWQLILSISLIRILAYVLDGVYVYLISHNKKYVF
ncbi:MAG: lipopolysaccharide biosynthesis protein [Methyloligellaceae bacterium]